MQIIPVLDLKNRQVVRGIAGNRDTYRPVVSTLTSSSEPLAVARAFQTHFEANLLYLADLDAIGGQPMAADSYAQLQADGFQLWVDAGVRTCHDTAELIRCGVAGVVLGLETLRGVEEWRQCVELFSPERLLFSLDLKSGQPLTSSASWGDAEPLHIVGRVVDAGCQRLIVLDLSRVGMSEGTGTLRLCEEIMREFPEVAVFVAGGIRDRQDLQLACEMGVSGVLLASALHDGRIRPEDLVDLRS